MPRKKELVTNGDVRFNRKWNELTGFQQARIRRFLAREEPVHSLPLENYMEGITGNLVEPAFARWIMATGVYL